MCMVGLLVGCEGNEDTVDDGNSLNWSLFRGDASLSGYTDRSLPKKPSLLWSYKSGVRTVSSLWPCGKSTFCLAGATLGYGSLIVRRVCRRIHC